MRSGLSFLSTVVLSLSLSIAANAHKHAARRHHALNRLERDHKVAKRDDNARFTYYEAGLGACGQTNTDSDFIVALNSAEYDGGSHCFEEITISYNGLSTTAQIADECPGCPEGGLDLTPGLFSYFASTDAGVIYGDWDYASAAADSPSPTPTPTPTTTSTPVIPTTSWTPTTTSTPPPPPTTTSSKHTTSTPPPPSPTTSSTPSPSSSSSTTSWVPPSSSPTSSSTLAPSSTSDAPESSSSAPAPSSTSTSTSTSSSAAPASTSAGTLTQLNQAIVQLFVLGASAQ